MSKKTTTIYVPGGLNASDRWAVVVASLKAVGIENIQPCPMPNQSLRKLPVQPMPIIISRVEV